MTRPTVRELVLPTALTVTTFLVIAACGDEDEDKKQRSSQVSACADLPSGACARCKDEQGKTTCGPSKDCYATSSGGCTTGNNS